MRTAAVKAVHEGTKHCAARRMSQTDIIVIVVVIVFHMCNYVMCMHVHMLTAFGFMKSVVCQ